jgi:aspartyl-tRNA(Asn)/glutamyl-tRNA(Gln) amidotransferase subunit B
LAREKRYIETLGIGAKEAAIIVDDVQMTVFFEAVMATGVEPKRALAVLLNNLAKRANEQGVRVDQLGIKPSQVKAVIDMVSGNLISSAAADELYGLCCADPSADPAKLAESKGLLQVSDDSSLDAWVDQAIAGNAKSVEAVKAGKEAAIGALVGAVMKLSKGKANPKSIGDKLRKKLLG